MVGSRLFELLLEKGYNVIGTDKKTNVWNKLLNKKTVNIDLIKYKRLDSIPKGVDMIIHLAANARVYELIKNPYLAIENIITTFNVMEFARKRNINKIIFSSSREIYGNIADNHIVSENERIVGCENTYSASKIGAEAIIHSYKSYGIDSVIIRFSNIYGMYDDSNRVIPLWIKKALKDEELIIIGKNKSLDFVHIDDAINGSLKIIDKFDLVKGEIFNIASGESVKLRFIANKIKEILKSESKILSKKNRKGETMKFRADITKAIKMLGYKPEINIERGLEKTVEWYKEFYG